MNTFSQIKLNIAEALVGEWTLTTAIGKGEKDCTKYYSIYTITFDAKGQYTENIKFVGDTTQVLETGNYKFDSQTTTLFFFNKKLISPQNSMASDQKYHIVKFTKNELTLNDCLCNQDEHEAGKPEANCKIVFKKINRSQQ